MKTSNLFLLPLVALFAFGLLTLTTSLTRADFGYDEAVDGDLSGDNLNPTHIDLTLGSNKVSANSADFDRDYFSVFIPEGAELVAVILEEYVSADDTAFLAMQSGARFTEDPSDADPANMMGFVHFGTSNGHLDTDILDDMALAPGAQGFARPLWTGIYALWAQQAGTSTDYTFNFVVEPIGGVEAYDEATDGDLSDDRLAPTAIQLSEGVYTVAGSSVSGDRDYFTVNVPYGTTLDAILLTEYVSTDDVAFAAVQAGTTFTEDPANPDVSNLLGWGHIGASELGSDILDDLGTGAGAIGFTPPLVGQNYTFWVQQTGAALTDYTLEFVVSADSDAVRYDEAEDGDISDNRNVPTVVDLLAGDNLVSAETVSGDRDYLTINIPGGYELTDMILTGYDSTDGIAFAAIQRGATFTEDHTNPDVANLLGYTHFGPGAGHLGKDILADMGMGAGAIGFTPPLKGSTYTLWMQQTGMAVTDFTFNFKVSASADAIRYDEAVDGDISGDRTDTTKVTLKNGVNLVSAESVSGDREYLTVFIPHGYQLSGMILADYESTDGVAFAAVQAGGQFTEDHTNPDVANLLGYSHFGPDEGHLGNDILADLGTGAGAIGFTPPLTGYTYTFWLQQTGSAVTNYTFNFYVTPNPALVRYDEAADGDISGDRTAPTAVDLTPGDNLVSATSVSGDREYLTVNIPEGYQLSSVINPEYVSADGVAFIAVQGGGEFTEDHTNPDVANILGYTHFGPGSGNFMTDILDDMAAGAGAIGFEPPLKGSQYTFWMQQTGSDSTDYAINFVITEKEAEEFKIFLPILSNNN